MIRIFSLAANKLHLIQWLAPLAMVGLVVLYEIGPSTWIHSQYGHTHHLWFDVLFYGTIGPGLVFTALKFVRRWMEERETSDLQASILEESRSQVSKFQETTDSALQALFASSVLLASLSSKLPNLTTQEARQLEETHQAIDRSIKNIRNQLELSSAKTSS